MNKQTGKQFGEDNPSAALVGIKVSTVEVAERRYNTAFPVSGSYTSSTSTSFTSVATGKGPWK